MNIFVWILFGLVSGVAANVLNPTPSHGGWVGTIVLAITGSVFGGLLANYVFGLGIAGFNIRSFIIAALGASLVMLLQRLRTSSDHYIKTKVTK